MSDFYDDPASAAPDGPRVAFYKRRDLGETLSDTFDLFRQNWREYAWGVIVLVAPLVAANVVISIVSGAQAQSMEMLARLPEIFSGEIEPDSLGMGPSLGVVVASSVLGILAMTMVQAATLAYLRLYRDGQAGAIAPGVLWEETKVVFLPVLGVVAASAGVVFVLFLFNIVPCLGQLAFLAGFLFLAPLLWMWPAARVFDADSVGAAFTRVRTLMKGHWGASLLALLLILLVVFVLAFALSVPFMVLAFTLGGAFSGPLGILSTAVGIAFYPIYGLPTIAGALHYFNLVERSEAVDLARRVDDLDDLDPPSAPEAW